jgi:hypothetical protein
MTMYKNEFQEGQQALSNVLNTGKSFAAALFTLIRFTVVFAIQVGRDAKAWYKESTEVEYVLTKLKAVKTQIEDKAPVAISFTSNLGKDLVAQLNGYKSVLVDAVNSCYYQAETEAESNEVAQ